MIRAFSVLLALCALASTAVAQGALEGIDVYRTSQVAPEVIETRFGEALRDYARLRGDTRAAARQSAEAAKVRIEKEISDLGSFAFVSVYYAPYFTSRRSTAYITVDLVDASDAGERAPFRPAPTGTVPDPAGLLAVWKRYSELGERLRREGAIDRDRPDCRSYYCVWGSATPELARLEEELAEGAPREKEALYEVLENDRDTSKRAAAVYVLAYTRDGNEVANVALNALKDSAVEVRSAGLRVLGDIALYHRDVPIDLERLLPALDYPFASERSLAMGALFGLVDNPNYEPVLRTRAAPRLLELLKQQQPSIHDVAYTLLALLAKEDFGRRDYEAWSRWILQRP